MRLTNQGRYSLDNNSLENYYLYKTIDIDDLLKTDEISNTWTTSSWWIYFANHIKPLDECSRKQTSSTWRKAGLPRT